MAVIWTRLGAWKRAHATGTALAIAAATCGAMVSPVGAAPLTVTVTSTADDGGPGTLRWAFDQVSAAAPSDVVTVELPAGTYLLTTCSTDQDDTNAAGDADVRPVAALAIVATGGAATIEQTCVGERVLDVLAADGAPAGDPAAPVELRGVTITGGDVEGDGGGIRSAGDVTLNDAVVDGNRARGPAAADGAPGIHVAGGGVATSGAVLVDGGQLSGNLAIGGHAGAPLVGLPTAGNARGGAIAATRVEITGASLHANGVEGGEGGTILQCCDQGPDGGVAAGGAVAAGSVVLADAELTDNRALANGTNAPASGGAVAADVIDVARGSLFGNAARGGAATLRSQPGGDAAGGALSGGTVRVLGATLDANTATGGEGGPAEVGWPPGAGGDARGGAVAGTEVALIGTDIRQNAAIGGDAGATTSFGTSAQPGVGRGGGAHATEDLIADDTDLADDTATSGLFLGLVRPPGLGDELASGGTTSLMRVHIDRTAAPTTATAVDSVGSLDVEATTIGGDVARPLRGAARVTLKRSTLAPSVPAVARAGLPAGAAVQGATVELTAATVVAVTDGSSTPIAVAADSLTLSGSLLTARTGPVACSAVSSPLTAPVVASSGGNVARDGAGWCGVGSGPADLAGDDPAMSEVSDLGDHGGSTPTVEPLVGNPAVDRAPEPCATITDQRGIARPAGPACDAGAVELEAAVISGRVRADATGEPARGVTVTLLAAPPSWRVESTTRTDATGTYRFVGVPAGRHAIRFFDGWGRFGRSWWASAPTYRTATVLVASPADEITADIELSARPSGAIVGTVDDGAGTPASGTAVLAFSIADGYVGGTRAGADGRFELAGLADGEYVVQFVDPSHQRLSRWYGGSASGLGAIPVTIGDGPVDVSTSMP